VFTNRLWISNIKNEGTLIEYLSEFAIITMTTNFYKALLRRFDGVNNNPSALDCEEGWTT